MITSRESEVHEMADIMSTVVLVYIVICVIRIIWTSHELRKIMKEQKKWKFYGEPTVIEEWIRDENGNWLKVR